jgi:Divergent InlB B-repeat domain
MRKEKKLLLLLILVLVGVMLFSSVPAWAGESHGRGKSLGEARKALEQQLLPLAGAGFVGIAHSEREGEITVFVENERAKGRVPRSFEGYEVRTKVTGRIQTLSTQVMKPLANVSDERRSEVRPLVGGISLSACVTKGAEIYLYAGTLSMVTYDDRILSNAHVIAMNPETGDFLNLGAPIIQPGTGDEGKSEDQVGTLQAYIPIDFAPNAQNYADAAVGTIDIGVDASPGEQFCEGGNYWIQGWSEVSQGDTVRKSGRTTGVTTGEVIHTNVSVVVRYGSKSAYFVDQIVVSQDNWSFAAPGDSGSAVEKDGEFVGLLFAGTEDCIVICKAEHIIDGLDVAVEPPENRRSLTVSSTLGGEVISPGEGMFLYDAGTVVQLVATADENCDFVEWTGDVSTIANVTAPSTNITMNGSYSIAANFGLEEGWHRLSISSTEGGSVTIPGEGPFVYANGTVVQLVATPDEHYHFVEWTGNVSTVNDPQAAATNITMNDSDSIAANFELEEGWHRLSVSSTEGGSVTTPGEGFFVYANSTVVSLIAQPDTGYQFLKWTGNVSTIADVYAVSTNITMNDSYSITANFESWPVEPMALLLISSTSGGSVITPGEGTFLFPLGSQVSLVAEPDEGCWFVKWSGDVGTVADIWAASTTITVDSPYSIRADFGGAGGCFIATAAYGTPMAEEIQVLREFRDQYLLSNPVGKTLVYLYYKVSPPIAEFINEHPGLKPIVRAGLLPAVSMSTVAVNTTQVEKIAMIGLLVVISVAVAIWATRQRRKGSECA